MVPFLKITARKNCTVRAATLTFAASTLSAAAASQRRDGTGLRMEALYDEQMIQWPSDGIES